MPAILVILLNLNTESQTMKIKLGTAELAIANEGSWFYLRLPNGAGVHAALMEYPLARPLVDAWRERTSWTLRIGAIWIEASGAVLPAPSSLPAE